MNDATALRRDPHVAARELLVTLEHPGSSRRPTYAEAPIRILGRDRRVPVRAPRLDERRAGILAELEPT